jgi:DNA repair protein RecN (Recombination protein N)
VARRLTEARAEVRDAALDLERYLDRIEADPGRLAAADERLHEIETLQRKYGADVAAVLAHRDAAAAELASIEGADARETEIVASRGERAAALARDAAALSAGRRRAARKLARTVTATLGELAMKDARFEVSLDPAPASPGVPCGPTGAEIPSFLLSANAGEAPRPLRRVASGGELSRAFLAIQQALRGAHAGMVLVFDEVDAGIGGGVAADRVGHCLAELAARHQVLVITHLPQIAAYAETHFRVRKRGSGGRTTVRIERVEGDDRVEEIARMAGGAAVAESTREHARALLRDRVSP